MIVLVITDSITSGAAIVIDGRIVAAVSEERLAQEVPLPIPRAEVR
jgi:predicted NodU family carbamoyl transferase